MRFGIIEFCCDEDSEIGKVGREYGVDVLRIDEKLDCMSEETIKMCMTFVNEHDSVHLHGSLPCTPWSNIQKLNIHQYGESFKRRLQRAQLYSLRLVARFLILARYVRDHKGTSSFEWPKTALGWKRPLVEQMIEELRYASVIVDGCSVG